MKFPSDDLFKLIKSMTKSEKRYFKRFAQIHVRGNQNNYIKLFDAIERQKNYNEDKLKRKFSGNHFVSYFAVEKMYLYNLILRSLRIYGSNEDVETLLMQSLTEIKILSSKGLFIQALRILERAKEKAIKAEKYLFVTELEKWRMQITYKTGRGLTKEFIENTFNSREEYWEKEKNISSYVRIDASMVLPLRRAHDARSKKEAMELSAIMNNPLQKDEKFATTTRSKMLYHNNLIRYYYFIHDYKKLYTHCARLLEIEVAGRSNTIGLFTGLFGMFNACIILKKYNEAEEMIKKAEEMMTNVIANDATKFSVIIYMKLHFLISTIQFDKAIILVEKSKREFAQLHSSTLLNITEIIIYNLIYLYIIKKNYSEALRLYTNNFNISNRTSMRGDVLGMSKILFLIIHYEMQNEELLEYLIKSTYRWFLKQDRLYKYEKAILDFIRISLPKATNRNKLMYAFKELKVKLEKIKKDKFEKVAFDFFDISSWLESKIENVPFEKILKDRYAKN